LDVRARAFGVDQAERTARKSVGLGRDAARLLPSSASASDVGSLSVDESVFARFARLAVFSILTFSTVGTPFFDAFSTVRSERAFFPFDRFNR